MNTSEPRRCRDCGNECSLDELVKRTNAPQGRDSLCKKCKNKRNKVYADEHREKVRESVRRCDEKHRVTRREYSRTYYESNKERLSYKSKKNYEKHHAKYDATRAIYRSTHKEQIALTVKAWSKTHPEQRRAIAHRRRTLKTNADGNHTAADELEQLNRQHHKCYYCGVHVGGKYHIDHVIPLSRGGSNGPENIVIACPYCNQSKNDKLPHEWPQGGRLL